MVIDTSAAVRGISKQIVSGRLKAHDTICCEDAQSSEKHSVHMRTMEYKGVDTDMSLVTTEVCNCVYFPGLILKPKSAVKGKTPTCPSHRAVLSPESFRNREQEQTSSTNGFIKT